MRVGQTSLVVFISKLIGSALGFVATIYFARTLGAEVIGYFALAIAIAGWLKLVGQLGVTSAMTKRMSEGWEPDAHFTAGGISVAILAVFLAMFIFLFNEYINAYVGENVAPYVALILLVALFDTFSMAALRGRRLVHISGSLTPLRIGTRSIAQIALVFAGFGLTGMLLGYIVGGLLVGVIGLGILSVQLTRPDKKHFRSLFDYAKYSWLGGLKSRSFNDVDIIILGVFVPSALVGIYSVAWSIAKFLQLFGSAVSTTLFPEISKADAEESDELVSMLVTDSMTYGGLFIIPGLFGGALLADRLLAIYGPEFVQGVTVLVVLILATLLYGYQKQLMNAINAVDRPDITFRINVIFIVTNVILNVLLILEFGFVGAAYATATSAGLGVLMSFTALRWFVDFTIPAGEIVRQFLAAGVMSAIVYAGLVGFETTKFTHNAVIVVTLVILGAGAYFLSLLSLSANFRSTVRANSPIRFPILMK